ncbi:centromere protein W isoform X1 [Petaurus breviceps papuanus]|uniref:centromere protein W isoform X1 n=1 Tax=Petaurus breviceps papuanus TaxID=3040969 RepID=UPI0036DB4C17
MEGAPSRLLPFVPPGPVQASPPPEPSFKSSDICLTVLGLRSTELTAPRGVHLNCLLFLHRLAEEARIRAFQDKRRIIKDKHIIASGKVILKKSKG